MPSCSEQLGIRTDIGHAPTLREVLNGVQPSRGREIRKYQLLILNTEEVNHDFSTALTADMIVEKTQEDFCCITNKDGVHFANV